EREPRSYSPSVGGRCGRAAMTTSSLPATWPRRSWVPLSRGAGSKQARQRQVVPGMRSASDGLTRTRQDGEQDACGAPGVMVDLEPASHRGGGGGEGLPGAEVPGVTRERAPADLHTDPVP